METRGEGQQSRRRPKRESWGLREKAAGKRVVYCVDVIVAVIVIVGGGGGVLTYFEY